MSDNILFARARDKGSISIYTQVILHTITPIFYMGSIFSCPIYSFSPPSLIHRHAHRQLTDHYHVLLGLARFSSYTECARVIGASTTNLFIPMYYSHKYIDSSQPPTHPNHLLLCPLYHLTRPILTYTFRCAQILYH